MAGAGDKTEEATPRQLEKARERGEVSQSRDVNAALLLAVTFAVLSFQIETIGDRFQSIALAAIRAAVTPGLPPAAAMGVLGTALGEAVLGLLPIFGVVFLFAMISPLVQIGPLISFQAMQPKLNKLNPLEGMKRWFKMQTFIELGKSAVKVSVVGIIAYGIVTDEIRNIIMMSAQPPLIIAQFTLSVIGRIVIRCIVFFAIMAVLDFFFQKWQYKKNLRMTKEEVKQEYKESEGDPHHKSERKRLHEEISQENMMQQVRKADVVVTNPTHIACALRYDPDDEDAPRLLGKGQGHIAEMIRKIAQEEDIPVVRDISLAHALYEMELNQEVPEELFDAVAEVLRWVEAVMKSQGETPKWLQEAAKKEGPAEE